MDLDSSDDHFQKEGHQNRDLRNIRNMAEKQRRDKLNGYITELANTVPLVTMSSKRLDKTSVLRLSAAYLRLNKTSLSTKKAKNKKTVSMPVWRPPKFRMDFLRSLIDSVEGFIVVTTGLGKIIYVSHSVENFLGHQNIDLIGNSLLSFLHPSDTEFVQNQIQSAQQQVSKGSQTSGKISFQCRLREKNQPRSDVVTYQMINVSGVMTANPSEDKNGSKENKNENSILFKGFVQIIPTSPMAELSLMDADLDEYVSRHSLDGTLLFADHRISGIIGFLPSEVLGKSAYSYILPDDHSIALFAHKLMLSNSNGTGTVVHRLRTASGSFVFLQSSGCLQYDKNGQIDHWVCVSRLLVEDEGDKERDKFVKRFTPHIYNISPTALYESLQIVIGPRSSNSVFTSANCLNETNKCLSNTATIRELESPSPPMASTQQSLQTIQNPLNSLKTYSCESASNTSAEPTISPQSIPTTQPQASITSTQMSIQHLLSNLNGANLQTIQSPVVQIQTLPIIPINSTQVLTQQTMSPSVNGLGDNSILSRSNSFSNTNVINLITPTPVSLSYVESTPSPNNGNNANKGSEMNSMIANNLISGHFENAVNIVSKPSNDLTHLLGATVLTFDAQNRPVISVYSSQFALKECTNNNINNNINININNSNNNNNNNINSNKYKNTIETNSLLNPKVNSCIESNDVSPSMDTSFYSPIEKPIDETPNETNGELWTINRDNCDEVSNHSTNSLMDFSFPSNDSQCDFGLLEDNLFEDNVLEEPFLSSCVANGDKRVGFASDETELDPRVETKTSVFDFQNPKANSSVVFTSKTNSN